MNIRNYSLEQIKALIVESTDVLVITSPASSDKNALSGQMKSIRDPYWRTSLILANENTNIESLSHEIIRQALPDRVKDKIPAESQVHKYLEYSALNGILPVIIVDDAHKLSPEVLEFILQLAGLRYGESLFRIVWFADEIINERLDDPKLKVLTAGVLHNIHTTSFTKEELKQEIKAETKESIEDVTASYDESDEYLFAEEDTLVSSGKKTSRSLVGLFLVVIGLISAFSIYSYLNKQKVPAVGDVSIVTETQQDEQTVSIEEVATVEEDEQEIIEDIKLADEEELSGGILHVETHEVEIEVEEIIATPYEELPDYVEEEEPPVIEDDSSIDEQLSQIESVPSIDEDMSKSILDIDATTEAKEIIETPGEELSDYVEEEEPPVIEDEEVVMPETMTDTNDVNVFNLESVPEYLSNIKGPIWLRQQPANSYVLQLISAQYESNLRNLLSGQSGIQSQLSGYVKYTPSGKPRYLLLYGIYPDRNAAEVAINELPLKFQLIPPWLRKISDVVNELDQISEPFIEIEEGIVIPLGEYAGEIEKIESPVIEDEEVVMPDTMADADEDYIYNLETIHDYLSGIKGSVWLRQQPANSYVLQLLSAQYMSNIKNLLSGQSGIQNQFSGYVKYTPSGKPRYLLLYGIYPDIESAEAAIDDLPVELQSIPPWPRKLGDVIKDINKRAEPSTDEDRSKALLGFG